MLFFLETGSLSERLSEGVVALIAGMSTVFMILILISVLISLFKFIGNGERSNSRREIKMKAEIEAAMDKKVEPVEEVVNETDELELVAVITAAIAASLNTTTDKLQVKSFRRINSRKG